MILLLKLGLIAAEFEQKKTLLKLPSTLSLLPQWYKWQVCTVTRPMGLKSHYNHIEEGKGVDAIITTDGNARTLCEAINETIAMCKSIIIYVMDFELQRAARNSSSERLW